MTTTPTAGVARSRFRFFGGKGGVGKTTCAAGAALAAEARGARVLLVSTDPAHSLSHVFARRVSARPRRLAASRGTLDVVELDADRALTSWIGDRRLAFKRIVGRGTYLDDEDIEALLDLAFPGVDELIGLLELTRLAAAGKYPEVIVDTAPTGHTLRLLAMPATLQRIAGILESMQAKHRYLSESLAGRYRPDAGDATIGEIEARGVALEAMLRDPRQCAFHWITLPETVAMAEARDGVMALRDAGISVEEVIINRVAPQPDEKCSLCEQRVVYERQAVAQARTMFRGIPTRVLPAVSEEPRGLVALRRIGRLLREPSPVAPGERRVLPRRRTPDAASATEGGPEKAWLDAMAPPGVRLLLFAGKGGVGKTTCAAAVALALADRERGGNVLLLSTDPAHSLGDVLAVDLDDTARAIPGGPPRLRARELDAGALFADRRRRYLDAVDHVFAELRGSSRFDPAFDRAVVENLVDLAPPGIDELLGLLAIVDMLNARTPGAPAASMIVVDTAPTGHVLRLLAMPSLGLGWVHTFMGLILKYRKVIGLGQLSSDLLEVSRELRQLQAALGDPRLARLVIIGRAAELSRLETRRLITGVNALHIGISAAVVNALTPPACARCRRAGQREGRTIRAFEKDLRSLIKPRCAIIGAPVAMPPPRGAEELGRWRRDWTRLDA